MTIALVVAMAGLLAPQDVEPERKPEKKPLPIREVGRRYNDPPPPKPGVITGLIVDLENWPVGRAKVTVEGIGTVGGDMTGVFEIPVSGEGTFDLVVEVKGFASSSRRGVRAGESVRITVRRLAVPERKIDGKVVDESGAPVAGARVSWTWKLDPPMQGETTSGGDGAIVGVGIPIALQDGAPAPELIVDVVAEGFAPWTYRGARFLGEQAHGSPGLHVVLARGVTVRGRVVDGRSGAVIPRATVRIVFPRASPSLTPVTQVAPIETTADAQGAFEFLHVPAAPPADPFTRRESPTGWRHTWLVASADGYAMDTAHGFKLAPDAAERAFEVRCFPACTIRGRVVDGNGAPVAQVRVRGGAHASWLYEFVGIETRSIAISDSDGRYELADVTTESSSENLVAQMETLNGWTDVPGDEGIWVEHRRQAIVDAPPMTIDPIPSVFLRVVDPKGAPIAGAVVAYEHAVSPRFITGADGRCTFRLPPSYRDGFRPLQPILVSAPGHAHFRSADGKEFRESFDPQVETRVVLEPECRLQGRVTRADPVDPRASGTILVLPDDTDLEAVRAWFRGDGPRLEPIGTAKIVPRDGTFEVRGLPSGRCLVVFFGRGFAYLEHVPTDSSDLQWTVTDEPEPDR